MNSNKVAIITGASKGIGRSTALKFAANNYNIALVGRPLGRAGMVEEIANVSYWLSTTEASFITGTTIPLVSDINTWHNLSTPAYSIYSNNGYTEKSISFHVYNWFTVNTGKLCPTGWHVPTDDEWIILKNYLGSHKVAGGKLKESGTGNWMVPNTGATNESGVSALPGGPFGSDLLGYDGFWWSSTIGNAAAWYRGLNYSTGRISRNNIQIRAGFCGRCLKD